VKHHIELLPYQLEAMMATEPEILISAGIGTGKSFVGAFWLLDKMIKYPGCTGFIAANTHQQLTNASVKTFTQLLEQFNIPYKAVLSGARKRIEIGPSVVYLYSLERPDTIKGIEVSFAWLDEIAFSTLEALQVVRGRMRGNKTPYCQVLMTSSPNGFNFLYDIFGNIQDPASYRMIQGKTSENIFLRKGYYESLLEQYGGLNSPLARQELLGEFVNLQAGAIYNLFDRGINVVECKLNPNHPVFVGVDFNIEKMSATYIQYIGGIFYQCTEVQLTHRDANTFDLGKKLLEDLKGFRFSVIPDSTGNARKSSATSAKSDHQILKDMGIDVMSTFNPLKRDRQNTVNLAFHKKQIYVDPSCQLTIKEIETLSSREDEGTVSHLSVTTGYVVWKLAPLKPKQELSRTITNW
jgi:phage terminase large subunit